MSHETIRNDRRFSAQYMALQTIRNNREIKISRLRQTDNVCHVTKFSLSLS